MVEEIRHGGHLVALIVRAGFGAPGIHFFTPGSFSQQLAYMEHPAGKQIAAHYHNSVPRAVEYTQEVLIVRKGRLRVDFYDRTTRYLESRELGPGDIILLAGGGHGFEVLEAVEMFEIKQGPYFDDRDKTRFPAVDRAQVKVPPPAGS